MGTVAREARGGLAGRERVETVVRKVSALSVSCLVGRRSREGVVGGDAAKGVGREGEGVVMRTLLRLKLLVEVSAGSCEAGKRLLQAMRGGGATDENEMVKKTKVGATRARRRSTQCCVLLLSSEGEWRRLSRGRDAFAREDDRNLLFSPPGRFFSTQKNPKCSVPTK